MILYAIANMGKLDLLTPAASYVVIKGLRGEINLLKVSIFSAVLFAAMLSIHFIRAGSSDESTIADILAIYIYSPLVALGYMNIDSGLPTCAHTLRFFYFLGNILDIAPQYVDIISPIIWIPESVNVYTIMEPFYYDMGLLGIFFRQFCMVFFSRLFIGFR